MRALLSVIVWLLLLQPATAPSTAPGLTAQSSVDEILAALHQAGVGLTGFRAEVELSDTDATTGDDTTRAGRVVYQAGDASSIRVVFETRSDGEAAPRPDRIEYLLAGGWLTDRSYAKRLEVRRQVLKPGEKVNILRLGEGPFPLPIGQDPAEVRKQFDVSALDPASITPPEAPLPRVRLTPREGTRLARKFSTIDVSVDPKTGFPVRIETTDTNKTVIRATELRNLVLNPTGAEAIGPADFALPERPDPTKWRSTEEAFED